MCICHLASCNSQPVISAPPHHLATPPPKYWRNSSIVAHATSDHPGEGYEYKDVVLPPRGAGYFDASATHYPTVGRLGISGSPLRPKLIRKIYLSTHNPQPTTHNSQLTPYPSPNYSSAAS